jgi:tripartite ATP-independent transporter DctM subunit
MLGILMFFVALVLLLFGFPVAFTFGAVATFFGFVSSGFDLFTLAPQRIWSIMTNITLMAVPLFVFMGIVLQKSGLAEKLLESMGRLFGGLRGGIMVSTVLVGALLAASTGVVGASVVAMGVIALPVMLKHGYDKKMSSGVICASGTLGQIIPPSIVLIILGDVLQVPVGDLFRAAVNPGLILVGAYILYILIRTNIQKDLAPPIVRDLNQSKASEVLTALKSILPPLILIVLVLGSIFAGVATPTESASVGCVASVIMAFFYRSFSFKKLFEASLETVKITAMVFTILVGATLFSMVFTHTGGDLMMEKLLTYIPGDKTGFILFAMLFIFILGFFIDFIEIAFIIVPMLIPTMLKLGINPLWFGLLIAVNLQTSFLTPPFGFSLFYLRGVAPDSIRTIDIYKGVVPFIIIQFLVLLLLIFCPGII